MDLRIVKTLREIETAFYALRRTKSLRQITVREIVQEAQINKTTFYRYYENIDQLIDTLETKEIDAVLGSFQDYERFFQAPGSFFNAILDCFAKSERMRGFLNRERIASVIEKVCGGLFAKLCACEPVITESTEAQCILKFFLYGVLNSHLICFRDFTGTVQLEDCYKINQVLEIPILAMMQSGML